MRPCGYCKSNESTPKKMLVFCGWWQLANYTLKLYPRKTEYPKHESRWVKETGGWIHEKKKNKEEF